MRLPSAGPVVATLALWAAAAAAAPPTPLDIAGIYSFPGFVHHPSSAASAGCALADRWLGDEPFDNPAAVTPSGVMLAPALVRTRRQDLATGFDRYDQTPAFLHAGGAWLSLLERGLGVMVYAAQPVLRREDATFTAPPGAVPGNYATRVSARETRAGLALSLPWRGARAGAAVEWTGREDEYDFEETSGDPLAGARHVDHDGSALGWQVGVRAPVGARGAVGAALRRVPALDLAGRRTRSSAFGEGFDLVETVRCTRAAAWEGGLSARWTLSASLTALAGAGGRGAQAWTGYGVTAGPALSWSVGLAWEDPAEPWAARAGLGQEQQRGVPEPRAGLVGLGLAWKAESLRLEAAVLHRSVARPGGATSPDDRVLAGASVAF